VRKNGRTERTEKGVGFMEIFDGKTVARKDKSIGGISDWSRVL
jgi:hypothetical protein